MESSIAEFLSRKLACELLPTAALHLHCVGLEATGPETHQGTQLQQRHQPNQVVFTITAFTS